MTQATPLPGPLAEPPLIAAITRMLRPFVRLLIRGGITCPTLMDVVRGVYVDVARDMLPDDRSRTDSRISLMTGVHRKELRRHRVEGPGASPQPVTIGSQVVARWLGQPGWQDAAGAPLLLPRMAAAGQPSFEALVSGVTRDVRPRAVLDDWVAQGLVTLDGAGLVALKATAFLPPPGHAEQLYYFGRNLHDHIAAAVANVEATAAPFLERAVHYDGLSAQAAAQMVALAREAAQRMLLDVNRQALAIAERDDADAAGQERRHRVNLGAYVFQAEDP